MSYQSPRRRPLSLVSNKSNSLVSPAAGSGLANASCSPSSNRKKLSLLRESPKASLETSREGRASLAFLAFEPSRVLSVGGGRLTGSSSNNNNASTSKLRARATTISAHSNLNNNNNYSQVHRQQSDCTVSPPPRAVPASSGPARRTRSKTLSKSQIRHHPLRNAASQVDADSRRYSCSYAESDNLVRTLDLLAGHVEEQGRRLEAQASTSQIQQAAPNHMLSAPLMVRSQATPLANSAGWTTTVNNSSCNITPPPTLMPPVMVPPLSASTASSFLSSSTSSTLTMSDSSTSQLSADDINVTPKVDQLSKMISDLQLFLPQAESLTDEQMQAFHNAVEGILGRPVVAHNESLGAAINLTNDVSNNFFSDDFPIFHVGWPSSLHDAPTSSAAHLHSHYVTAPSQNKDSIMLDDRYQPSYSVTGLEHEIRGMGLQVQPISSQHTTSMDFSNFDNDLDLVPPQW